MRALLIRHCESSGQAPEAPLTATGVAQAMALADSLAGRGVDHVVSSPYARARGTIQPFAERAGLVLHTDPRLAERRLSPEPIPGWRDVVRRSFNDLDHRAPGGESAREVLARAWDGIRFVLGGGHRLPVIVSHGQLLSLVLHSVDASFGYAGWEGLRNPDVLLLEAASDGSFAFTRP
jgi:2,3-bisphosphoglycerate-dependent phosphoglycerate mutase